MPEQRGSALPERSQDFPRSRELVERARKSLAGGVSSHFRAVGTPHPMFYENAVGSRITDVDGNRLLDFTLSQGPCILGQSHPKLVERVSATLSQGQLFGGQHLAELELSEAIAKCVPCAELIRFSVSGSEAAHALLRLARHVTGRSKFVKFVGHYHGWLDNFAFSVNPPRTASNVRPRPVAWGGGIPSCLADDVLVLPWNDLAQVEAILDMHGDEIAAIITEPIMCNQGCIEPEAGFLEGLRSLCDSHGVALVFDEIITGFRLGLSGAQGHYGVVPDMALFGKALGAGFPISALAGKTRFMEPLARGEVYHAGTMNGGNASIAAASTVLEVMGRNDSEGFRHLWRIGARLRDAIASLASSFAPDLRVQGPGPMFHVGFSKRTRANSYEHVLDFDRDLYAAFCRGMLARGVRLIERGLWYVSLAHTDEDVDLAVDAAADTLSGLKR